MPIQYYMRAFKITPTTGYVDWIVNDNPDATGIYSGYSPSELINITVNRSVQSKVENFLKPQNSKDGYFFHINSYDWIHPPTPPFDAPIPPPPQIAGIAVMRGSNDGLTPRDEATLFWDEINQRWSFAFNTNGDGYTVGAAIPVSMGSLFIDGYLELGTDPAHSGILRIPNAQEIKARNADNTGDVSLIEANSNNEVQLGSATDPVYIPDWLRLDGYLVNNDPTLASLVGFIRNPNSTSIITFRDVTNTNNLTALSSSGNLINIGDNLNAGINYNTAIDNLHSFQTNGNSNIELGSNFIRFTGDIEYPIIYQADRTVGNGQNFVFKAQNTSDLAGYGGAVILNSGTGPAADGYIDIRANDLMKMRVFGTNTPVTPDFPNNASSNSNSILINNPTIRFYDSIINPTIKQDTANIASISGQPLTILAQNNIGASSFGGQLNLSSGSGLAGAGNVNIQTGQITKLTVSPTTITSYDPLIIFDSSLINPVIRQSSISGVGQSLTLEAQRANTGGDLILVSGEGFDYGGTLSGNIRLQSGIGSDSLIIDGYHNLIESYLRSFIFDKNVTDPFIGQEEDLTPGIMAQDFRIQAQNAPTDPSGGFGGNLILSAGDGYDQRGKIQFQINTSSFANLGVDDDPDNADGGSGYLDVGAIPATAGSLRIPNSSWIEARNADNTANIKLIGSNSSNQVIISHYEVTDDALNILTNGSNADGYHTHSGILGTSAANYIVGKIGPISNNTDGYLSADLDELTDENFPSFVIGKDGYLHNLIVTCSERPSIGESIIITVRKNKVDTILTATLNDSMSANTVGYIVYNVTNIAPVIRGDWITIRYTSTAANVQNLMVSLEN